MKFDETHRRIFSFVGLAYGITIAAWSLLLFLYGRLPIEELLAFPGAIALIYIGGLGPTLAAVLLTFQSGGGKELKQFLATSIRFRVGCGPWLLALVIPVGAVLLAALIASSISDDLGRVHVGGLAQIAWLGMIVPFFAGPLCEELGWRGYLQPQLLRVTKPGVAALLIGTAWCFWHIPLSMTPGTTPPLESIFAWLVYYADTLCLAVVMLVLVIWARGSVVIAMLFHWASNVAMTYFVMPLFPDSSAASWERVENIHLVILACLAVAALLVLQFRGRSWMRAV